MSGVALRPMTEADGPALAMLAAESPDTGQITFAPHYLVDAYRTFLALRADTVGVVAEVREVGGLVGAGLVSYGHCQFEGQLRPYAYLNSLIVHPHHRRRGIAAQLARWRVEHARQRFGDEGVILANIQKGNTGSQLTAQKWHRQLAGRLIAVPAKMRPQPPAPVAGWAVRAARPADFEAMAQGLNQFYQGYNFHQPQSVETLTAWQRSTPFETPFRHHVVAVDSAGAVRAGLSLTEVCRLRTLVVRQMPAAMRLINRFLNLVPADGTLRELSVESFWFAPGQVSAARYLWETIRWEWRDKGTVLTVVVDPNSPLMGVFAVRAWTIKAELEIAVHAPVPMSAGRLICPIE